MNLFEGCSDQTLANGLRWFQEPPSWSFSGGKLTIVPAPQTDFFRGYGREPKDDACLLYVEVSGDFTARTRASADPVAFGDAAAVTVRAGSTQWAKLCLERSPIGEVSAVSVVTDPWSDDANNELLDRPECDLRLTRKGAIFAMHYRTNDGPWRFVRTFAMDAPETVMVGVHAQAPFKGGCRATFRGLEIEHEPVDDFRSGE